MVLHVAFKYFIGEVRASAVISEREPEMRF